MVDQPLNIYLELEPGQTAELAVVARAAIELDRAFREAAFLIDPSAQIQLNIVEGELGSLNLKTVIRGAAERKTLLAVATTLAITVGADIRGYTVGKAIDYLTGQVESEQSLSEEDVERIALRVLEVSKAAQVQEPVRNFYKELARSC